MRSGKSILVYEDGNQLRDFVHVSDAVRACVLAAESNQVNLEILNVGSGRPLSILQLAQSLVGKLASGTIELEAFSVGLGGH